MQFTFSSKDTFLFNKDVLWDNEKSDYLWEWQSSTHYGQFYRVQKDETFQKAMVRLGYEDSIAMLIAHKSM